MNRRRVILLSLVILAGLYACARVTRRVQREVTYAKTLRSYSDVLKPGMSRIQVESYLKSKNPEREIGQICCLGVTRDAWADLVQIATEEPSWPCIRRNIYVALERGSVASNSNAT